jgi:hypothetical protein
MYICKGCCKEFSPSGYTSHLNLTQNGLCISAYHHEIQQLEHAKLMGTVEHTDTAEHSTRCNDKDDMRSDDEDGAHSDDEDGARSDDEDGMRSDDEDGVHSLNNEDFIDIQEPRAPAPAPMPSVSSQPEPPVEIEPFPSESAGRPIRVSQAAGAEDSENNCQQDGSDDVFEPFKSRLEWEVVKWAKLRGSSSTALTELLAIEGVSDNLQL